MGYIKYRQLGKNSELMIMIGTALCNDEINIIDNVKYVAILKKKMSKCLNSFNQKYGDLYSEAIEMFDYLEISQDNYTVGTKLKELGRELRQEVPFYCQGNIIMSKYFVTSLEMLIITIAGIVCMLM